MYEKMFNQILLFWRARLLAAPSGTVALLAQLGPNVARY